MVFTIAWWHRLTFLRVVCISTRSSVLEHIAKRALVVIQGEGTAATRFSQKKCWPPEHGGFWSHNMHVEW